MAFIQVAQSYQNSRVNGKSIHLARGTLCKRCSCSFDLSFLMPYCCTTILSVSVYEDSPLCILNKLLDEMSATVINQRSRNEIR